MNVCMARHYGFTVCICFMMIVLVGNQEASAIQNLRAGDAMPAFSLSRANGSPDAITLEQLKGKPTAIVFWRPNQKLSLEGLDDMEQIAKEAGPSKINIVAVDASRSNAEEIKAALGGKTYSFPILLDPQRALYGKVGVIVSPTTLLLDNQGVLRFVAPSHPPQYRQVVLARLRFLLGETNEEQMKKEIEPTALKINHEVAAAWRMYNLGRRLQSEGKSEQAIASFENAVSKYPSLPEARCALGFMRLEAGDLAQAAKHFQTALAYQPTSSLVRLGQAAVLARTGQAEKAEKILLSLLGHKSVAVRVRYELGRIYHARGELDKAVTYFQDAFSTLFPEPRSTSTPQPPSHAASAQPAPAGGSSSGSEAQPVAASSSNTAAPKKAPSAQAVQPIEIPADAKYIGIKRCKKCHLQQWMSWKDTKMAKAFDLLKPGVRAQEKTAHNLDPQKNYSADAQCLKCHTMGFGFPGGYQSPPPGDAKAARAAAANAGIGCESCHGPGNKYEAIHKDILDKKRKYKQDELFSAGQNKIGVNVCARCHDENAPCIAAGKPFDFEQRKNQGTHKHYDLQLRAP